MEKSKGHICFNGEFEFYERNGEVYKAPINAGNVFQNGYRFGRWECSINQFNLFKDFILI